MKRIVLSTLFGIAALLLVHTGCATNPTTGVKTIDPAKLAKVKLVVEPAGASVLRRAIVNSPQHSVEIGNYARAVGGAMCQAVGNQSFTPLTIANAVDQATQGLQANVSPDVIDAKNALLSLYAILYDDQLTVSLPNDQWPSAVLGIICDSVDLALKDAGQRGVK